MTPWESLERIKEQPEFLAQIAPDDPFWVGASYAIDPFVGMILHLPLRDPPFYGKGVPAELFDKIVPEIINRNLHGNQLVAVIEKFSRACTAEQWSRWYRPILKGELVIPLSLAKYNEHAPHKIRPPALNKPKTITLEKKALPDRFFIQPLYEDFSFWVVNAKDDPVEVRGYDSDIRRLVDLQIEEQLVAWAVKQRFDVVVTGYKAGAEFLIEDLLSRDQFTRETATPPLFQRLLMAIKLGLPVVQMSDEFAAKDAPNETFWQELRLIQEQGYKSVVFRDLDGKYPFREQPDRQIAKTRFAKMLREVA